MQDWPTFAIWYNDLLRVAYSWNLSRQEAESVPPDWYTWCWQRCWPPYDALYAAMVDVGLMNANGYFD